MAAEFAEIMNRVEVALTRQSQVAEALDRRITQGDTNIEQRFSESEKKVGDALAAMGAAIQQLAAATAAAALAAVGPPVQPAQPAQPSPSQSDPSQQATTSPPGIQPDPWAVAAAAARSGQGADGSLGGPPPWSTNIEVFLRPKDFAHIVAFDGDLNRFPDWADRMMAKLVRAHPKVASILDWTEKQVTVITEQVEQAASDTSPNVTFISNAVYDILMERTGPRLFDKRRNAGTGRGLE